MALSRAPGELFGARLWCPPASHHGWQHQEPCLCRSWHSATPCTGCCCQAAYGHHLLQLFFLPFLCSLERNQGYGLNKSHSQPTKPPPCSPGKCMLQTRGLCQDMTVKLGGTSVNHGGPALGKRAVVSGKNKGMAAWSPCLSCWRMKGPVLWLHHCKWPHVDVFTQCGCRNMGLGCLSHSGTCVQRLVMGKQQYVHARKHAGVSCHLQSCGHRCGTSLLRGHSSTSKCSTGLLLLPAITDTTASATRRAS